MVMTTPRSEIASAIRAFPAKKGTSRTVNGNKQYQLYRNTDSSGRGLVLVGFYDSNNNNRLTYEIQVIPKYNPIDAYIFDVSNGLGVTQTQSDAIVDNFIRELGIKEQEQQQFEEDSQKEMEVNIIQEEVVRGQTISITEYLNAYVPTTQSLEDMYMVTIPSRFGGTKNFPTLDEAQEYYNNARDLIQNRREATSQEFDYNSYKIVYQSTTYLDGEADLSQTFYRIEGLDSQFQSTFNDGDIVEYRGATATETFGTISLDVENDLIILKQYLDIIDNPPQEEAEPVYGLLPIYSWGWYQSNNDNEFCPFEKLDITNGYTVAETNGRILGLEDDDFIAGGFESGLIRLKVKEGYRVQLKIMTQERGFLEQNISNLDTVGMDFETYNISEAQIFNQATNYVDTEKVKIDLYGGDILEINIDGIDTDPKVRKFYLTQRGSQISSGGGMKINDETFLAVIEVERYDRVQNGDSGSNGESKPMTFLPILIGGVLILGILYLVFAGGGEE